MAFVPDGVEFVEQKASSRGGLNVSVPAKDIAANELVEALNVEVLDRYRVHTRFGYEELGSSTGIGTGKVQGLAKFYKTTGTNKDSLLIFTNGDDGSGNNIFEYRTDHETWSSDPIGDLGTTGARVRGRVLNDVVVFGNGVAANTMKKWDGTTLSNVTTSPPDGNVFTVMAKQMYCLDPNVPSKVYRSDTENPDVWSGGASDVINVDLSDGWKCKGIFANQNRVNVLKEQTKHYITLLFDDTAAIVASKVMPFRDTSGGCIAPDTVQEVYSDIFTLAELHKGIQRFGEFEAYQAGNPRSTSVSKRVNKLLKQINRSAVEDAAGIFYDNKYIICVPMRTSQTNNYGFVYNWEFDNFVTWDHFPASCFETFRNSSKVEDLIFGSASQPKIFKLNKRYSDAGYGYTRRIKTKVYNNNQPHRMKVFSFFDIMGALAYSTVLTIYVYIDEKLAYTTTLDKDSENIVFVNEPNEAGIYGVDYYGAEFYGGDEVESDEVPLFPFTARIELPPQYSRGKSIQIAFESADIGHGWYLDFPYANIAYYPETFELEN